MTNIDQIARGIAWDLVKGILSNTNEDIELHVDEVAKALREYGDKRAEERSTFYEPPSEWFKNITAKADVEGYRRGVEKCVAELRNWKVWTPDHVEMLINKLQRGQEGK